MDPLIGSTPPKSAKRSRMPKWCKKIENFFFPYHFFYDVFRFSERTKKTFFFVFFSAREVQCPSTADGAYTKSPTTVK